MPDKPAKQETASGEETASARNGVKRPLVPLVLALMLGLAGAAWGVQIPRSWLIAVLAGLLVVLFLLYFAKTFRNLPGGRKERQR